MKKILMNPKGLLIMVAALTIGLAGCDDTKPVIPTTPVLNTWSDGVINNNLTVGVEIAGGESIFGISGNRNWTISVPAEATWLTVTPLSGNAKETPVEVTVKAVANTGGARSAVLTIKPKDNSPSKTVTVRQTGTIENQITIAALRALPVGAIDQEKVVIGRIISDASAAGGNSVAKKNIVIQDATAGIMIRLAVDPTTPYALGEELQVSLKGLMLELYSTTLQLNNVLADVVEKTGAPHAPVAAKSITPAQLFTGEYASQYVAVSDVQFLSDAAGKLITDPSFATSGHASVKMESKDGGELGMFVAKYAAFYTTPMTIPAKSGIIKGIAGDKQVQPQTAADFAGLTEERFSEGARFGVSSLAVSVPSKGGDVTVNVTGNVEWRAAIKDGAVNIISGPTPGGSNGAGSIVLTFPPNTDENNTKVVTLVVSTAVAAITEKSFDVVFTQAKALPAGEQMVVFDIPTMGIANAAEWGAKTIDGITITAAGGGNTNTPKYYTSGTSLRTYQKNTLTFTGGNIVKIEAETGGSRKDGFIAAPGTLEGAIWTGSANSVVFTTAPTIDKSQHHYVKFTITYKPA